MSKNSNRSIDKKLTVSRVYPLPEQSLKLDNLSSQISLISKNRLTNDILHDAKINKFVLEEDLLNFFPTSGDNDNSSGSQESWADDLEITTTKNVKAEYELVERLLYGEERFDVYNKEFDQWVDNFKYLRVLGSGIKLTNARKTNETETEEIIAEHKDVLDSHWLESNYLMEIKNKVKAAVMSKILEDVRKRMLPVSSNHRPKWKDSRNDRRNTLTSTSKLEKGRASLPLRMESLNRENCNFGKKHPIIRSNISSAKWQKSSVETFDLPVLSSREKRIKKNSARNFRTEEEKSFTLPPIGPSPFERDANHTGFFLRSNSCNTNKREFLTRSRASLRTSSSRIVDS